MQMSNSVVQREMIFEVRARRPQIPTVELKLGRASIRLPKSAGTRRRCREPIENAERAAVPDGSKDEAGDAFRRTRLANERTYLAWWRTGLASFAVGLAAGKLVPELSRGPAWPFELVGTAFGVVGIALIVYAWLRQKQVEEAIDRGGYAALDARVSLTLAAAGVILGLGTILIILVESS
jgi:putative membrane protein